MAAAACCSRNDERCRPGIHHIRAHRGAVARHAQRKVVAPHAPVMVLSDSPEGQREKTITVPSGSLLRLVSLECGLRLLLLLVVAEYGNQAFYSDVNHYFLSARDLSRTHLPYRDFLWEFPPLTTIPLVLIPILDRNQAAFAVAFVLLFGVGLEYGSLVYLRRAFPEKARDITVLWSAAVLPLCSFAWFRLDWMSVFPAVIALVALERHKRTSPAIIAGICAKVWPVTLCAVFVARREWQKLAEVVAGTALLCLCWYLFSPQGVRDFLMFRRGSGYQVESTPGAVLLLAGLPWEFRFGAVIVAAGRYQWIQDVLNVVTVGGGATIAAATLLRRARPTPLVASLVLVLLVGSRIISPQYLVWLAPFVALCWQQRRSIGYAYMAASMLTLLVVVNYPQLNSAPMSIGILVLLRNLILLWMLVLFLRETFLSNDGDQPAAPRPLAS